MVLVLKNECKRPKALVPTTREKLALYDTMFAYSGTYTVTSDRVTRHLDMSWNESVGSHQPRTILQRSEGNILTYAPAPGANTLDDKEATKSFLSGRFALIDRLVNVPQKSGEICRTGDSMSEQPRVPNKPWTV